MPTRFRIAYSCADASIARKMFGNANYQRLLVNNSADFFNNDQIKQIIATKEVIFKQFDGGDRLTFDRMPVKRPDDVVNEISYILNTYSVPFFRYKFTEHKETPLTRFI